MRTTLTLERDVAERLSQEMRRTGRGLKAIVNEALRLGLRELGAPPPPRKPFVTKSVSLGQCLVGSIDDVAETLALAEGEPFR